MTISATTNPIGQILSAGFAYRTAANEPTKLIVLIGMWMLWGPTLLASVGFFIWSLILLDEMEFGALFMMAIAIWWFTISSVLLYRTTKNYRHLKSSIYPKGYVYSDKCHSGH
jgi:hypothetical protein